MRNFRKKNFRRPLVACILVAICLYSGVRLVQYLVHTVSARQTNAALQEMFESAEEIQERETAPTPVPTAPQQPQLLDSYQYMGDDVLLKLEKLIAQNPDTVAWLRIPGGIVDLPVVYRDNTYYLDHDFYGRQSDSGTLFLDENHPFLPDTQYMVIHGHNRHDGSMFGILSHYVRSGYLEEHPTVYLYTLYREEEYEVIGVLRVPEDVRSEEYVPYIGIRKFRSLDQFYDFAGIIRENAIHWKEGAEMLPDDAFLALSTCYEEERIVVICRRVDQE